MPKLVTPISHLFENTECANEIIKLSDYLECRDRSINATLEGQILFHCEIEPIHTWTEKEIVYLKVIRETKPFLKLLSLHIASNCSSPVLKDNRFFPGGVTFTRAQMLDNARQNLETVKNIFGQNVKIAVENNNYYPTPAYKDVTDPDFISDVVYENDINFLFDIAHAKVTCYNRNMNFERYKAKLPFDRLCQIHICSYDINEVGGFAYDAHNRPNAEELVEVKKLIKKYAHIEYLTVEYYRDIKGLCESLVEVRGLL
ncbi:DUF692 family protein [Thiotrichales bacterium 19S11-10]|nr:DUF692 family protein [Thiotrichales bacterium 19S11-10]